MATAAEKPWGNGLLALLMALWLVGCGSPATEVVVWVKSDDLSPVSAGGTLASVAVRVTRDDDGSMVFDNTGLDGGIELGSGRNAFPGTVAVVASSADDARALHIYVTARLSDGSELRRESVLRFTPHQRRNVYQYLSAACVNRMPACPAATTTCGRGGLCERIHDPPTSDPPLDAVMDAGLDDNGPTTDVPTSDTPPDVSDGGATMDVPTADTPRDASDDGTTMDVPAADTPEAGDDVEVGCASGSTRCGSECRDLTNDRANCGVCGVTCANPRSVAACRAGACVVESCLPGFADCDGNPINGCEVDTPTSLAHCGGCGRACAPANGVGACAGGSCRIASCNLGFSDCDGAAANGCEVEPIANNLHCGACGNPCVSGRTCIAGRCAVPAFGGYDVAAAPPGVDWIDACAQPGAQRILVSADDDLTRGVLPFPVEFWGSTNFIYFISSNGWVGFGDYYANVSSLPAVTPYGHFGSLPRMTAPYPAAFVFGVDLVQGPGGICVANIGTAPNRRFIVQSPGAQLFATVKRGLGPSAFSYELIAYEATTNLDMVFNAPFSGPDGAAMTSPTNVTVGLQDFRMPLSAVSYNGPITATTRLRFSVR